MKVFALYDPAHAGMVKIWARSWRARGWDPRLITVRDVKKYGSFKRAVVAKQGKVMTRLNVINFSFRPTTWLGVRIPNYPKSNWRTSSLVKFSSEEAVFNCGRPL